MAATSASVTIDVCIKSANLDREQAARAEAILVADKVLRTRGSGLGAHNPGAAIDLMSVADYIIAGFEPEVDVEFHPEAGGEQPMTPEEIEAFKDRVSAPRGGITTHAPLPFDEDED